MSAGFGEGPIYPCDLARFGETAHSAYAPRQLRGSQVLERNLLDSFHMLPEPLAHILDLGSASVQTRGYAGARTYASSIAVRARLLEIASLFSVAMFW
jgi:hypothetical protein